MESKYIRCSSAFTPPQQLILERLATETDLITLDDISSYKRSCCDVSEVQRAADFLIVCASGGEHLSTLLQIDSRFAHVATKLRDILKGEVR